MCRPAWQAQAPDPAPSPKAFTTPPLCVAQRRAGGRRVVSSTAAFATPGPASRKSPESGRGRPQRRAAVKTPPRARGWPRPLIPSRPSGTHCSCWLEHLAHEGRRRDLRGMLGGRRSPRRGGAAARWRWCRGGAARGSRWVCASKAAVLVVAVRATRWGGARWQLAAVAPGGGARRGSGAGARRGRGRWRGGGARTSTSPIHLGSLDQFARCDERHWIRIRVAGVAADLGPRTRELSASSCGAWRGESL